MRKKAGLLVVALALLVVTAAPAAKAGAVTFIDENGALENEAGIELESGPVWLESGMVYCEELFIETSVAENSADPATLQEAPGAMSGCSMSSYPLKKVYIEDVEIGQIAMASNGKGAMPIEFKYHTDSWWGGSCPKMSGTVGVTRKAAGELAFSGSVNAQDACQPFGEGMNMAGVFQFRTYNGPADVIFP